MIRVLLFSVVLWVSQFSFSAAETISQMPLGLQNSIPANLMLLYDSSGSMSWDLEQTCETKYRCDYIRDNDDWDYGPYNIDADYTTSGNSYYWGDRRFANCEELSAVTEGTCLTSRRYVAEKVARNLIDDIDGFYVGLMKFHRDDNEGGELVQALILLDSDRSDYVSKQTEIKNEISGIEARGSTPLAESMSAVGYYFSYEGPQNPIITKSTDLKMTLDTNDANYNFVATPKDSPAQIDRGTLFGNSILHRDGASYPSYNGSGSDDLEKNASMAFKGWCQKSFAITMTDGEPTRDTTVTDYLKNHEDSGNSDYLADVAGALWNMDMRPDLCDPLLLDELNDEYNLSMTQCSDLLTTRISDTGKTVYVTLEEKYEETSDNNLVIDDGTLHRYKNNVRSFLIGFADGSVTNNPLLQEAARWGGGKYYGATDGKQLAEVFNEILRTIASSDSSASGIGINLAGGATDYLYRARFNAAEWAGDLGKYKLIRQDKTVSLKDNDRVWSTDDDGTFPAHGERVIFTYDGLLADGTTDSSLQAVPFRWDSLSATNRVKLDLAVSPEGTTDSNGDERLDYLRGDRSNEVGASDSAIGFRKRTRLLGDIIHSTPSFVGKIDEGKTYELDQPVDVNLTSRWNRSIDTYANSKQYTSPQRLKNIVYVNANDGMLHAFDDEDGKEIFAYVPSYIASNTHKEGLHYLTDINYQHRFYSDATPWVKEDVYLTSESAWRTLLVTGTAAGGRGVSLLDITDVHNGTITEANASDVVLWEFTHPELGYTFPEPYIGPLRNGKWGVIIGNGYNSASGKASVFIIDVEPNLSSGWVKGVNFYIIETSVTLDATYGKNGMSTVVAADVYQDTENCVASRLGLHHVVAEPCVTANAAEENDGTTEIDWDYFNNHFYPGYGSIDRLYGGDLYGNLWAINLASQDPTKWAVDFNGNALFKVPTVNSVPQPITAPPRLAWAAPIIMRCDGYMKSLLDLNLDPYELFLKPEVTGAEFGDTAVIPYSDWLAKTGIAIPDSSTTDDDGYTEAARRGLSCGPNVMVTFGTGQFITEADVTDTTKRALYAVWDNYKYDDGDYGRYPITIADLDQRAFSTVVDATSGNLVRTITDMDGLAEGEFKNTQWHITDEFGWYVNFDQPGERLTSSPFYYNKTNEILFATIIPDDEACGSGGSTIFNRLDIMTGLASKDYRVQEVLPSGNVIGTQLIGLNSGITFIGDGPITDGGEYAAVAKSPDSGYDPIKLVNKDKAFRGIVSWYEVEQP